MRAASPPCTPSRHLVASRRRLVDCRALCLLLASCQSLILMAGCYSRMSFKPKRVQKLEGTGARAPCEVEYHVEGDGRIEDVKGKLLFEVLFTSTSVSYASSSSSFSSFNSYWTA